MMLYIYFGINQGMCYETSGTKIPRNVLGSKIINYAAENHSWTCSFGYYMRSKIDKIRTTNYGTEMTFVYESSMRII